MFDPSDKSSNLYKTDEEEKSQGQSCEQARVFGLQKIVAGTTCQAEVIFLCKILMLPLFR